MQTLSATLLAAQKKFDVQPALAVLVSDNPPEAPRLAELVSLYTGSEPDVPFDACWTGTWQIARAYVSAGVVYAQVVTPPSNQAGWSAWTQLDNTASPFAATAPVALYGTQDGSGVVYCFWVAADGHTVRWSTWNGSNWSALSTAFDYGAGFLVASLAADGMDPTIRIYGVISGGNIFESHYSLGVWSAPNGDGGVWAIPTMAAAYRPLTAPSGDGNAFLVVASGSPTTLQVKEFNISGGQVWVAGSTTIQSAGVGSGYSYAYPKLAETRSDSRRSIVSWNEVAPAPLVTGPIIAVTPTHSSIQGQVPWRYPASCTHGLRVFRDVNPLSQWWVISSNQVYTCSADTATPQTGQRISFAQSQLVDVAIETSQPNHATRGHVTVTNENGALKDAGQTGSHKGLRQWSQVAITLGYQTGSGSAAKGLPAGSEGAWQTPLWIDSVVFHDEVTKGTPLVTINLIDAWGILEQLHFRWSTTYTSQTIEYILDRVLWYVSGVLGGTGNARLSAITLSSFTIRAGESLGNVARRLADLAAVALIFRTLTTSTDGTGFDSVGYAAINWASGGSLYSFGPSAHPILQSEVQPLAAPSATSVEVAGAATWSVVRNWTPTWLLWRDIQASTVDKTLSNQAATDAVAANLATLFLPELQAGQLLAFANVGQEIADQVDLTIATAPIAAQLYTVHGLALTWTQKKGILTGKISLQGTN